MVGSVKAKQVAVYTASELDDSVFNLLRVWALGILSSVGMLIYRLFVLNVVARGFILVWIFQGLRLGSGSSVGLDERCASLV